MKILYLPLAAAALLTAVQELVLFLSGFSGDVFSDVLNHLNDALGWAIPIQFVFFTVYHYFDRHFSENALWAVLCFLVIQGCIGAGERTFTVCSGALAVSLVIVLFSSTGKAVALPASAASSILFGILFYYLKDNYLEFQSVIAGSLGNSGMLSAFFFGLLEPFGSADWKELFFHASYGGTLLTDHGIISGVQNIFLNNTETPSFYTSVFLSGKYLFSFVIVGLTLCVSEALNPRMKKVLWMTAAASIVSGRYLYFILFLFLETPFLLALSAVLSGFSYLIAYILDFRCGYRYHGGIIEQIYYLNNWYLVLICGIVFLAISYFTAKYTVERWGISERENLYLPEQLRALVHDMGGIHNILRIRDCQIEVRNPKLINELNLDCEICENVITVKKEISDSLQEYF